ncbi:phytolongin Phyl1.1-like [Cynara cardunculus var. scolymus]|uniref:phytolongin Phyl1.1-like n=1 Tax=Cynara cardunculus var. scolymus TaxID=59895 RepID=UPI000D62BFDD|nr:phytolongin Phyl1.1-like [Cynara cardunculus var. scolymus]
MGSIRNTVYYCCVWNGGKVLYAYNGGGDCEIENLAALCLEKAPSHHKWYFQTMFKKTFGFLMEDGYIYFAIIDENLGNPGNLQFLEHVRDEFKKVAKKGSNRSMSNLNSLVLQEQLVPVIRRLITSLEQVTGTTCNETISSPYNDNNGQLDMGASTKAPLLGKSSKQEKRKMRDHVISVRENGVVEEHRKSADKGGTKVDSLSLDSSNQGGSVAGISLTKEVSSMNRSSTQTVRNKWCRQVRIVLAIDVAVCLILFIVWIVVCHGTECIR